MTYIGANYSRPSRDSKLSDWVRGRGKNVTQEWLDNNRGTLDPSEYLVEGDEAPHSDLFNDGVPDGNWRKAEILSWLDANGVSVTGGYKTKSALLALVQDALSPPVVEEPVEEPVETIPEVVEEPIVEEVEEVVVVSDEETTE